MTVIYFVQFEANNYEAYVSLEDMKDAIYNKCALTPILKAISAYNIELNDFTIPSLINGNWDSEYNENFTDEVNLIIRATYKDIEDNSYYERSDKKYWG